MNCSCCGQKGKSVQAKTVRALVHSELARHVMEEVYVLCVNPGYAQVYTAGNGGRSFIKDELQVRVGFKEHEGPHLVCYCFNHTVEDIEKDIRETGSTTIPVRIKEEIQAGRCQCTTRNPGGSCCLGSVNRAVKDALARVREGSEISLAAPRVQCGPPSLEESHNDCCGGGIGES